MQVLKKISILVIILGLGNSTIFAQKAKYQIDKAESTAKAIEKKLSTDEWQSSERNLEYAKTQLESFRKKIDAILLRDPDQEVVELEAKYEEYSAKINSALVSTNKTDGKHYSVDKVQQDGKVNKDELLRLLNEEKVDLEENKNHTELVDKIEVDEDCPKSGTFYASHMYRGGKLKSPGTKMTLKSVTLSSGLCDEGTSKVSMTFSNGGATENKDISQNENCGVLLKLECYGIDWNFYFNEKNQIIMFLDHGFEQSVILLSKNKKDIVSVRNADMLRKEGRKMIKVCDEIKKGNSVVDIRMPKEGSMKNEELVEDTKKYISDKWPKYDVRRMYIWSNSWTIEKDWENKPLRRYIKLAYAAHNKEDGKCYRKYVELVQVYDGTGYKSGSRFRNDSPLYNDSNAWQISCENINK